MEGQRFLIEENERIGFYVHDGDFYWVVDWAEHFNIDQRKNIDAMCNGSQYLVFKPQDVSLEQWRSDLYREFRFGIPNMTSELFLKYLKSDGVKLKSTEDLRLNFFADDVHGVYLSLSNSMEKELSFNKAMPDTLVDLRINLSRKLPKFYINFDRKIFMHMVKGRSYESTLSDGWWGSQGDFEHMIPVEFRYWVRTVDEDYWALTNFSNYD